MLKQIKKLLFSISLALYNTENNTLSAIGTNISDDVNEHQRYRQGTLADDLKQGRITEEVRLLRARTYKIIEASSDLKTNINIMDNGEDGYEFKIGETKKKKRTIKIKPDGYDDYNVLLIKDNTQITSSVSDTFDRIDKYGLKEEYPINIIRDILPKFKIEKYTKKLIVREIDDNKRLLEFYVSKYPEQFNRTSNIFLKQIPKIIENPITSDFIDVKSIDFITYNDMGVKDFLYFKYNITSFDKIIEHDGSFVFKFIADVEIESLPILDKYKHEELDLKYKNKEFKKKL